MCHGFYGGYGAYGGGYGGFGIPGIMGMAGGIFQSVIPILIVVAAVCAIRWFVKNTNSKEGR